MIRLTHIRGTAIPHQFRANMLCGRFAVARVEALSSLSELSRPREERRIFLHRRA